MVPLPREVHVQESAAVKRANHIVRADCPVLSKRLALVYAGAGSASCLIQMALSWKQPPPMTPPGSAPVSALMPTPSSKAASDHTLSTMAPRWAGALKPAEAQAVRADHHEPAGQLVGMRGE